jgi:hypothetical protein
MENLANIYEIKHEDTAFIIFEKTSGGNIGKYTSLKNANKVLTNLVNGVAFQGWTPSFFNVRYEKHGKN